MSARLSPRRLLRSLLLAASFVVAAAAPSRAAAPTLSMMEQRREQLWETGLYDAPSHPRLGKPEPGEWLASFPEYGETPKEYRERLKPLAPERRLLYLAPFGKLPAGTLEKLGPVLAAGLGLPWKETKLDDFKPNAWDARRRQLDASAMLAALAPRLPEDAAALLLVVEDDLWAEPLNFVFGVANPETRVGVFSLARLDTPRRLAHLVQHEVGHVLGLDHCIYYRCLMQGVNSLAEVDANGIHLCPVCLDKLAHRVGVDPRRRAASYAKALERAGLAADAKTAADALAAKRFQAAPAAPTGPRARPK
ncbi:MAG TPA: archaemetzincin [Myxococcales bacterium]